MNSSRDELFEMHEPPSGGIERMRRRLHEQERRRARRGPLLTAAASIATAAVLATVLIYLQGHMSEAPRPATAALDEPLAAPELDRLLGRPWSVQPPEVSRGDRELVARELPSADPNVRIYEID